MSADDTSDDESSKPYLGTRMGRPRTNAMKGNAALPLTDFGSDQPGRHDLGMAGRLDETPTVWDAVNYPHESEFEFESFYLRYVRQSEAKAIIDKPANDTWQSNPVIHDEKYKDTDEPVSDFEKRVQEFLEGEHTRRKPIHRLNVLHRLARLGRYAVLVIGMADGRPLSTPVAGATDERIDPEDLQSDDGSLEQDLEEGRMQIPETMSEPEFEGLDDLLYLAVFGEDRIVQMDVEGSMRSERFRLPIEFDLITQELEETDENTSTVGDEYQQERVHWTRAIHVPQGTLEDDLEGIPVLKAIFHELLNVDKIKAASGEGFWRGGYQGIHVQPPTDARGEPMEFEDGGEGVHEEIRDFLNNFDRTLSTPAELTNLDSSVENPMPHLEANYQSMSAATDIPKSILTGEDRADTASSEDVRQWHQKVGQIRNNFAAPVILEPLIHRLIDVGILPQPEGDGFVVDWQPLDEMSEQEQWELRQTVAETISTLSPGQDTSQFAIVPELRQAIGWSPNLGDEVDQESLNPENQLDEADLTVDEDLLPDIEQTEVRFPNEMFQTPMEAEKRSVELGLGETYHVIRVEGETWYMPGDSEQELAAALGENEDGESQSDQADQPTEPDGPEQQENADPAAVTTHSSTSTATDGGLEQSLEEAVENATAVNTGDDE